MINKKVITFFFSYVMFSSSILGQTVAEYKDTISDRVFTYMYDTDTLLGYRVRVIVDSHVVKETFVDTFHYKGLINNIGPVVGYDEEGNITYVGEYDINSHSTGTWLFFFKNGSVYMEMNYKRDVKDGIAKEYYEDRKLKSIGEYDNPEKIYTRPNYTSKVGIWKYYYSSGNINRKEQYWDGEPIKKEKVYNLGEVNVLGADAMYIYKQSVKHGRWEYYNEEGVLTGLRHYYKGKLLMESGVPPQKPADQ